MLRPPALLLILRFELLPDHSAFLFCGVADASYNQGALEAGEKSSESVGVGAIDIHQIGARLFGSLTLDERSQSQRRLKIVAGIDSLGGGDRVMRGRAGEHHTG